MSTATVNGTVSNPFMMKAAPKSDGGTYDLCPAGNHGGVLVAIVDLGTHEDSYQGKIRDSHNVVLAWELPGVKKPDGRPFVLAKQYGLSFTIRSNLRIMVETWRGRAFDDNEEFDVTKLLGKKCLVNVGHKPNGDKAYHEIKSIGSLPQGMPVADPTTESLLYTVDMGSPPPMDFLPYLYGRAIPEIIAESKERSGKPFLTRGGKAAPDTPYSSSAPAPASAPLDDFEPPF